MIVLDIVGRLDWEISLPLRRKDFLCSYGYRQSGEALLGLLWQLHMQATVVHVTQAVSSATLVAQAR